VLAVDQLSFTVERGTVTGFLGPDGAGKTTTLRMLLGLVTPSSGTAVINGRPYRELPEPRHVVGAVLEASNPYPSRTAVNHLRIEALAGDAPRAQVDEVLDMVDLTAAAGQRVGQYSLGMRQRLGLATALLCAPETLILDEPANGLTERATQVIRVRTPRPAQLAALLAGNGASARLAGPDRLEVTGAPGELIGTLAVEAAIPIYETTGEAADLEDVFLQLTGHPAEREVIR
jgi:ABC-2 type transport system ATP-binding protein